MILMMRFHFFKGGVKMQLYKISQEYILAFEEMKENGFDEETIKNTLSSLNSDFDEKCKSIAAYIIEIEGDILILENHKRDIAYRTDKFKKEREFYREYLKDEMIKLRKNKIKDTFFDISVKNSIPKLIIKNELSIPASYFTTEKITKLDNKKLKSDVMDGIKIEDVHLEETKSLTIKCK
jgi:hypothetical protein